MLRRLRNCRADSRYGRGERVIEVAGLALPFFGLIFLGILAGRVWRRSESDLAWLNLFVLYFALPALFFQLISRTPVHELANGRFVLATSLATVAALVLGFLLAMLRSGRDVATAAVRALIAGYGNVGYMGPPLALVALGAPAAVPAAIIFCFDVTLIFTLAPLVMAIAGVGSRSRADLVLEIPRRVVLHPFILASAAGVLAAALDMSMPAPVDRMLTLLSAAAAPCALFALGVTVAARPLQRISSELLPLILIKLAIHPMLAFAMLALMGGFDDLWVKTAVLMASLPPAATIYVVAQQYNVQVAQASSAILIGTAVSVPTVTGVLYLVTHDLLPWGLFGA